MNNNPENQFKRFLIIILLIVFTTIGFILKPDLMSFFDSDQVMRLSSKKPWQEAIVEEKNDGSDLEILIPQDQFRQDDDSIDKADFDLIFKHDDNNEYWVTGSVPINQMSDFNGMSFEQIFKNRKYFVENTIFKNTNYAPSKEVFGYMSDKNPWLGIEALTCNGAGANANLGLSADSRFVNNPTMLIGLDRINFDKKNKQSCSVLDYLLPIKINYSKDENTIKVVVETSLYQGNLGQNYILKAINARDLGFEYGFVDRVENINFTSESNISNSIYKFKDMIYPSEICGTSQKCNNSLISQKEMEFSVKSYPAKIHLRLWRKMPKTEDTRPDINYLILLR